MDQIVILLSVLGAIILLLERVYHILVLFKKIWTLAFKRKKDTHHRRK